MAFWDSRYFAPLDGLRTLSVLMVVAFHVQCRGQALPQEVTLRRLVEGHLAVDIFFVLSGFLITTLLLREERETGRTSLKNFYGRRFFRIIPVYCFGILAYLALGLIPSQHDKFTRTIAGLPYFFTVRNEYIPEAVDATYTHTWSLAIEEKFYFIWPILFFLLLPKLRARWLAVTLPVALYLVLPAHSHFYIHYTSYISIFIGCCVAIAMEAGRRRQARIESAIKKVPTAFVVVLGLGCYYVSLRWFFTLKPVFSVFMGLLIPFLVVRKSALAGILGSAPLAWIGKRTYAMYLLHAIFLNFVENKLIIPSTNARYLAVVAITFALVTIAGQLTYLFIEQPMIRAGRRLLRSGEQKKTVRSLGPQNCV